MPYVGSFYMDVILPNENLTVNSLIKQMNMEQYENSTKVLKKYDIIDVSFPKFHVKSEIDLKYPCILSTLKVQFFLLPRPIFKQFKSNTVFFQ